MKKITNKDLQDLIGREVEYEYYRHGERQEWDNVYIITKSYLKKDLIIMLMKSENDFDMLALDKKEFKDFIQEKNYIKETPLPMGDLNIKPYNKEVFILKPKKDDGNNSIFIENTLN